MRARKHSGSLSVQAIAGSHVVLLGLDLPEAKCSGLLGFALRRTDHTEGETYWLSGYKTFASVEPDPPPGLAYSTRVHPIQGFTWSDFSAKPEHEYSYEVVALRGTPQHPEESERVKVRIRTESPTIPGSLHHVHFNRGAAASQEYTRRFGDKSPREVGTAAFEWLSRGALEALLGFIARATGPEWGLRVSAYEFTDGHVLSALKDAWKKRKADVEILYHAANDDQKKLNEAAIQKTGFSAAMCHPRKATALKLSHHKVIVLLKNQVAQAVLTGSTNFSEGGIYGHSNVVHICEDAAIADRYLQVWKELKLNRPKKDAAPDLEALSPLPPEPTPKGTRPLFSPRPGIDALQWYADRAKGAKDALFMSFAFGMHPFFQDAYRTGSAPLRYALMEKMSGPTKTAAETRANEKLIIDLRKMEPNKFAVGAFLRKGAFNHWLAERLSGLNTHVRYVHTKYMLIDPLGPDPLVVSGSANFSKASTIDNDENMLVIRGDKRVADLYLGEFMRLYNHFAFRDWLSSQKNPDEAKVSHLDEKDLWWKRYFGASFAARQREYFAAP